MSIAVKSHDADALREVLRQSEISGAQRRAVLLHTNRLPPTLSRPHHVRLARGALECLLSADRAQLFELSLGRIAIVWRSRGGQELTQAIEALGQLLAGQPDGQAPALGELLTQYDLPDQAVWLLDELADPAELRARPSANAPNLDVRGLARLETNLAQADLSRFLRWRAVHHMDADLVPKRAGRLDQQPAHSAAAWEERYVAVHELAASICPDHNIKGDPWLFRRLTRTLDNRMLSMLTGPRDQRIVTIAIYLNVATILSQGFLRFDETLPASMRGRVIITLRLADILADPAAFNFARNFTRTRGYKLGLAGATPSILRFFDIASAGLDYVTIRLTGDVLAAPEAVQSLVPPQTGLVLSGLERPSDLRWAAQNGFTLGRGRAFDI